MKSNGNKLLFIRFLSALPVMLCYNTFIKARDKIEARTYRARKGDTVMDNKEIIIQSGRRMAESGLTVETWGNLSLRDPETGLIYLTPSAMSYEKITPDDVVVCGPDGTIAEGHRKPTVEKDMHIAIYRARADVNAIVHTHPTYSMVYACQGRDIPLIIDEAAQILGGVCHTAAYHLPGTEELANEVVKTLGKEAKACLLRSHGAVCVGEDMGAAFRAAIVLETTAKIYYMIEATGHRPLLINVSDIDALKRFMKNSYGQDKP